MNRRDLIGLAKNWMSLWQGADLKEFNDVHHEVFVDHSADNRGTSRDDFSESIAALYEAFPDFKAVTQDILVDEESDTVTIRWSATGTHARAFQGHPPTNKTIAFAGIEIIQCRDGKVFARWGEWDGLAITAQLRE